MKMKKIVFVSVMMLFAACLLIACGKKANSVSSTSDTPSESASTDVTDDANEKDDNEVVSVTSDGIAPSDNAESASGTLSGSADNGSTSQDNPVTTHVHVRVKDDAVEATCQKAGLTEGAHCSVCGEVLVNQQTVPKVDHKYENGTCIWCHEKDPYTALIDDLGEFELPPIPG